MMSVVDTMIKRSQMGGRRSHLADEITALYFNQNNNAKMCPKKRRPCISSCVPCIDDCGSDEDSKYFENKHKIAYPSYSRRKALYYKHHEEIMKQFNAEHSSSMTDVSVYNEIIGGELEYVNSSNINLQLDEEIRIRSRTDLTPPNVEQISEYCCGVKKCQTQVYEAMKQLELIPSTDKLKTDSNDNDVDEESCEESSKESSEGCGKEGSEQGGKEGGTDSEDSKKKKSLKCCPEGLKNLYCKMKTIFINRCSCCICCEKTQ